MIATRAQFDKLQSKLPPKVKIPFLNNHLNHKSKMNLSKLFTPEFRQPPKQLVVIGREKTSVIANTPTATDTKR